MGFGLDQAGAQQRALFEVEGLMRLGLGQGVQALLALRGVMRAEVAPVQLQRAVRRHALGRYAVEAGEGGAQGLVPHDQRLQGALESLDVQRATQPRHAADVVGRAVRRHLPEEPHALLGIRQRHGLAPVDPGDFALPVMPALLAQPIDLGAEGFQLAGFEQGLERQVDVAGLAAARDDLGGQQRMTAQGKEIVAQADPGHTQHLAPDRRHLPLHRRVRLDVLTLLPDRRRQRLVIELAAGAQGHPYQVDQLRRHQVGRQALAQGRE